VPAGMVSAWWRPVGVNAPLWLHTQFRLRPTLEALRASSRWRSDRSLARRGGGYSLTPGNSPSWWLNNRTCRSSWAFQCKGELTSAILIKLQWRALPICPVAKERRPLLRAYFGGHTHEQISSYYRRNCAPLNAYPGKPRHRTGP